MLLFPFFTITNYLATFYLPFLIFLFGDIFVFYTLYKTIFFFGVLLIQKHLKWNPCILHFLSSQPIKSFFSCNILQWHYNCWFDSLTVTVSNKQFWQHNFQEKWFWFCFIFCMSFGQDIILTKKWLFFYETKKSKYCY